MDKMDKRAVLWDVYRFASVIFPFLGERLLKIAGASEGILTASEERLLIVEQFGTLVSAFTGEHVGEPRLIISLYDSPVLHVDFKFTTLDGLLDRVEDSAILYEENNCITEIYSKKEAYFPTPDLQWIEDRFWIWVHYTCTKIGRRELFETIDFLSFLRQSVLASLIQLLLGKLPRGVRKIELDAPQYIEALEKTVAILEKAGNFLTCFY